MLRPSMKVGKLLLLGRVRRSNKAPSNRKIRWRVQCECGTKLTVPQMYLLRKKPKTHCGCQNKTLRTIHNREYRIWVMMRKRCTDPNHHAYKHYGGRGISVYEAWFIWETGFEEFIKYIGPAPSKKYSLDRINVDGNYEPGNVRWATAKEQANNKRKV